MTKKENVGVLKELVKKACLPAAEEIGEILRDKVGYWKTKNRLSVLDKTQKLLSNYSANNLPSANPRVFAEAIELCGKAENEKMQELWGGLIASSFSGNTTDDQNIIYINLLNQLTTLQGRILDTIAPKFKVFITDHGLIMTQKQEFSLDEFLIDCNCNDRNELDISLDHLREIGLIEGGIDLRKPKVFILLRPIFLNLYARCKGWSGDIMEFYKIDKEKDLLPPTELEAMTANIKKSTSEIESKRHQIDKNN